MKKYMGRWERGKSKERPLRQRAYKSEYIGNDNCSTSEFFYMPAPYLSPCSRCHTTGCTAKVDLVMLHPGQTFLTLSLANLSIHTLLLIFYHDCWLLLLLLWDLFVINLVFSLVHPVPDVRIVSLHHCPLRFCCFRIFP